MTNDSMLEKVIKERRTIRTLSEESISPEILKQILESARFAPFHSKYEPWQVTILDNQAEHHYYAQELMKSYERLGIWNAYKPEKLPDIQAKSLAYFQMIPLSIIVSVDETESEKETLEATAATASFIQNIQLLAWEKEIGVTWRTTPNIFETEFKIAMGLSEKQRIIGVLHFTQLVKEQRIPKTRRQPIENWSKKLSEQIELTTD